LIKTSKHQTSKHQTSNIKHQNIKHQNINQREGRKEMFQVKQIRDWDCGLACVSMVLQRTEPPVSVQDHETASQFYRDIHFPLLSQHVGVTLIWTIDIAWLLHHHNVPFSFSTLTLGASSDYSDIVSFHPPLLLPLSLLS